MATLRTAASQKKYDTYLVQNNFGGNCPLCTKKSLQAFNYWRIVQNDFPYDLFASVHHMIVPYRHVQEHDLTNKEKKEYHKIKKEFVNTNYEYIIEATNLKKSIPAHFHIHLIS